MELTLFAELTGILRSVLHLTGILIDFATFCDLIQKEASTALQQPGAELVWRLGQEVDETDSLLHEALPVRVFHHHTWNKHQQSVGGLKQTQTNILLIVLTAFTFSNGLCEAGEELMVLGQSERSAF